MLQASRVESASESATDGSVLPGEGSFGFGPVMDTVRNAVDSAKDWVNDQQKVATYAKGQSQWLMNSQIIAYDRSSRAGHLSLRSSQN